MQVQDTLASAWHAAPNLGELDWPTLGGLLGLVLLTSLLTAWASHWVNPVRRQMGTVGGLCTRAEPSDSTRAVAVHSMHKTCCWYHIVFVCSAMFIFRGS